MVAITNSLGEPAAQIIDSTSCPGDPPHHINEPESRLITDCAPAQHRRNTSEISR